MGGSLSGGLHKVPQNASKAIYESINAISLLHKISGVASVCILLSIKDTLLKHSPLIIELSHVCVCIFIAVVIHKNKVGTYKQIKTSKRRA